MAKFLAKIQSSSIFKELVEGMKDVCQYLKLQVSAKGLAMQGIDQSHVSITHIELGKEFFVEFDFEGEEPLLLMLKSDTLHKVLRACFPTDILTLQVLDSLDMLSLTFETHPDSPLVRTSTFRLGLIEAEESMVEIPKKRYSACIEMNSNEFINILKNAVGSSSEITFIASKKEFKMLFLDKETSGEIEFRESKESNTKLNVDSPVEKTFNASLLLNVAKSLNLAEKVLVNLSEGVPLLLVIEFNNSTGKLESYVAPKLA